MFLRQINLYLRLIILKVTILMDLRGSLLLSMLYTCETCSSELFYMSKKNTAGYVIDTLRFDDA